MKNIYVNIPTLRYWQLFPTCDTQVNDEDREKYYTLRWLVFELIFCLHTHK